MVATELRVVRVHEHALRVLVPARLFLRVVRPALAAAPRAEHAFVPAVPSLLRARLGTDRAAFATREQVGECGVEDVAAGLLQRTLQDGSLQHVLVDAPRRA